MKNDFKNILKYYLAFIISFIYWELILRVSMGGVRPGNLFFLFFIPAEALLFTVFTGFTSKKINRVLTPVIVFIPSFYYIAQCVYYRNFFSLFSVSMIGMGGDAIGNFWWALKTTLIQSLGYIGLLLVPFIASVVLSILNKPKQEKYRLWLHASLLVLVAALWIGGIFGLKLFGTERSSAYYTFMNSLSDTDTTSDKFGALTTTLVEAGTFYFGIETKGDQNIIPGPEDDPTIQIVTPSSVPVIKSLTEDPEALGEPEKDIEVIEVPKYTPWINEAIDFNALREKTSDKKLQNMCDYFATREGTITNDYTGLFEGYNLIYICAEAFSGWACNEQATPTLYKMAHNGIVLNNFYNSFKNTTTNGEYAFATSMWPDTSRRADCGKAVGSFPQSATRYMPQGLGKLFTSVGASAYAFHNYNGSYYSRNVSWPNLGYECYFKGKGMKFTTTWPASDLEMMEQSVDKYIADEQFNAYYMTFSGHGPYNEENCIYRKNIDAVKALLGEDTKLGDMAKGYLACQYELDKAMEYLLNELDKAGKLENTVIVIVGDHYPYYVNTKTARNQLAGYKYDMDLGLYESTCIIYCAGLETPVETDTFCCNVDILPTILNLFNIPFESRVMMGTDIFSTGTHKATSYNGSFKTEYVTYNSGTGKAEWTDLAADIDDETKKNYLDSLIASVEAESAASTNILSQNFLKFVWYNSGLMTDEELAAEEERAGKIKIKDVYDDDIPME